MSTNFLKINFLEKHTHTLNKRNDEFEYRNKPFSNSQVFCSSIFSFKQLAHGTDVRTVYQLDLSLKDIEHDFLPGDTIAILPENDETEVNKLLIRLNIEAVCDKDYHLEVLKDTPKKNVIPKHIPLKSTLRNVFLKHIDIRNPPKKIFLKNITKYTTNLREKEKLEMICSPAGSQEYTKLLTEHRTLLSLLDAFPCCLPPIELILEHSTPLNPRYYSIASSPLEKNVLSIIFFILEFENGIKGICTGWLQKLLQQNALRNQKVPFYFRKPSDFRMINMETPKILIATGTGIAPFWGFLQHKQILSKSWPDLPETWLFYGCRYSDRDFLCQNELKNYLKEGVLTKLYTAFSRETERKIYVQQKIVDNAKEIVDLILNKEASVYVCGDAKTTVKDVREVITKLFMECNNLDRSAAENTVNNLVKTKRYLVDMWI